jgi:hypothetical protein
MTNKNFFGKLVVALLASTLFTGAAHAGLTSNGLSVVNGLTSNGLTSNGLSMMNGLTSNGLTSNGLSMMNGLTSVNGLKAVNGLTPRSSAAAPANIWSACGIDPTKSLAKAAEKLGR